MNKTIALAFASAAMLVAAPAQADWEKTRWGDSVEAVIAKAGPGTEPFAGTEKQRVFDQDQRAKRRGKLDELDVEWQFFFDKNGGLSVIKMIPQDYSNCPAFLAKVRGPLGTPVDGKVTDLGTLQLKSDMFADKKKNLAMLVLSAVNSKTSLTLCHITYQSYGNGKPGLRN